MSAVLVSEFVDYLSDCRHWYVEQVAVLLADEDQYKQHKKASQKRLNVAQRIESTKKELVRGLVRRRKRLEELMDGLFEETEMAQQEIYEICERILPPSLIGSLLRLSEVDDEEPALD